MIKGSSVWDEKYRQSRAPTEPAQLLVQFASLLPPCGRALDLACGGGRNSVFLAQRGLTVIAVDSSLDGLRQGRELASRRNVQATWVCANLERFRLPTSAFDVIVCFSYREPTLYPAIRAALRKGGLLFYETFTLDQLRFGAGPQNPVHLLEAGELLKAFGGWDVFFYRETWMDRGVASLVARKPAFY